MVYVASDLHGISLEEFQKLLNKAGFTDKDFMFLLGDVIDRGEHSVDILKWLLVQPNVEMLLGNHEAMMLSCKFIFDEITDESIATLSPEKMELLSIWISNQAEPTLKAFRKLKNEEPDTCLDIIDYLEDAPLYETVSVGGRDFLICHTFGDGFEEGKPLSQYLPDTWLWSRPELNDEFFKDVIVVFGHTPTSYYGSEFANKMLKTKTWIDIDTSPNPCLLRLDDMKEFYL